MQAIADQLRSELERAMPGLVAIDEEASRKAAPGKWCAREILGHLIDSAAHNHQRFVRAQLQDDLVFEGYDQDAWVRIQNYREASWPELVELWRRFNLHLAHVIEGVAEETAERPRARHNLDAIAWRVVPADQPTTLAYFMRDYVAHLSHHLLQVGV